MAVESMDEKLSGGKVGLAKFRATEAQFRLFRVGKELGVAHPDDDALARVRKFVDELPAGAKLLPGDADRLTADADIGIGLIRERAAALEDQAAQLKKFARAVHHRRVEQELVRVLDKKDDDEIDLFHAALLVARLDNEEVDVEGYRLELARMASEISGPLAPEAGAAARLAALNKYLFDELGFHGSRGEYYHRSNSYVNEVLDDREGIPITLSVIYIELARKIGLNVVGVGLPGHFVVRHEPPEGEAQVLDVFDRAEIVTREEAEKLVQQAAKRPATDSDFASTQKRAIIVRMLHNLFALAQNARDAEGMLRYLDAVIAVDPGSAEDRFRRAGVLTYIGRRAEALADTDWLLEHRPEGVDLNEVDKLRRQIDHAE
jgi:regulator of sirC expression with transglutaminase-like and TPR domain